MSAKVDIVSCLLSMDCEEALRAIFLSLDGSSLDACSCVCKSWHNFLQKRLWHSQRVRPFLEAKLRQQWKLSRPTVLDKQIKGKSHGFDIDDVIVCDDELTLVGMEDGVVKVIRNERPSRGERGKREEEESSTVFTLDCRNSHLAQNSSGHALQFWLGSKVIVTVGNGVVQCWSRLTGTREYEGTHHEKGIHATIYAVTVLRSGMVATGADEGEVVVVKREVVELKKKKKEKWWKRLLVTTGEDEGPIWSVKAKLVTEDRGQVTHMHTDPGCNHTAVGTRRAITLWDLEEGHVVEGSKIVREYASMLIYIQPHAYVLNRQNEVGVWNMMTGDQVKRININVSLAQIKSNGSEVILSRCCCQTCWMEQEAVESSYIFVFDAAELSDPSIPAESVRWREFLPSGEVGNASNVEAAINKTSIVAVFPKAEEQRQGHAMTIKTFEFWRAESPTEEDERNSLGKMMEMRERIRNGLEWTTCR